MKGTMVPVMNKSTHPNIGHEKEDSPGTKGMGNRVNEGGKGPLPRITPKGGRLKSKRRNKKILKNLVEDGVAVIM